jgi:hypothetical protein
MNSRTAGGHGFGGGYTCIPGYYALFSTRLTPSSSRSTFPAAPKTAAELTALGR